MLHAAPSSGAATPAPSPVSLPLPGSPGTGAPELGEFTIFATQLQVGHWQEHPIRLGQIKWSTTCSESSPKISNTFLPNDLTG